MCRPKSLHSKIWCLGSTWASNTGPLRQDGATEADPWFIHWVHCFWTSVFMDIKNALLTKTGWFWINTVTLEHNIELVHWQVWFMSSCHTHPSTPLFWCLWRVINVWQSMFYLNKMRCTLRDRVTASIKMYNLNNCNIVSLPAGAWSGLPPTFYLILCLLEAVRSNITHAMWDKSISLTFLI